MSKEFKESQQFIDKKNKNNEDNDNLSDSMINCEHVRFERQVHKNFTAQPQQNSIFEKFFSLNDSNAEDLAEAHAVIQGLNSIKKTPQRLNTQKFILGGNLGILEKEMNDIKKEKYYFTSKELNRSSSDSKKPEKKDSGGSSIFNFKSLEEIKLNSKSKPTSPVKDIFFKDAKNSTSNLLAIIKEEILSSTESLTKVQSSFGLDAFDKELETYKDICKYKLQRNTGIQSKKSSNASISISNKTSNDNIIKDFDPVKIEEDETSKDQENNHDPNIEDCIRSNNRNKFHTIKYDSKKNEEKLISSDNVPEINIAEYLFKLGNNNINEEVLLEGEQEQSINEMNYSHIDKRFYKSYYVSNTDELQRMTSKNDNIDPSKLRSDHTISTVEGYSANKNLLSNSLLRSVDQNTNLYIDDSSPYKESVKPPVVNNCLLPLKKTSTKEMKSQELNNSINEDVILSYSKSNDTASIICILNKNNSTNQTKIINVIKKNAPSILSSSNGLSFFLKLYSNLSNYNSLRENLLDLSEFVNMGYSNDFQNLIDILSVVNHSNTNDRDIVYELFNKESIWKSLIPHRNGKNVVEYLLTNFYINNASKHKKLFELLESNFLDYSIMNYTTFVIQKYVQKYRTPETFVKIIENLNELTACRNGIFVIISALKSYKNDDLNLLLDKIMSVSEHLCKNVYASTLMEYIFSNHTNFSAPYFVENKIDYLLGKKEYI